MNDHPQVGEGRFGSLIAIHAERLQAVAAGTGCDVGEWFGQAVSAVKPIVRAAKRAAVSWLLLHAVGRQRRVGHGDCLDRLLVVERLLFAMGIPIAVADGPEDFVRGGRTIQEIERCLGDFEKLLGPALAGHEQRLGQYGVGIRQTRLKPLPVGTQGPLIAFNETFRRRPGDQLEHVDVPHLARSQVSPCQNHIGLWRRLRRSASTGSTESINSRASARWPLGKLLPRTSASARTA